MKLITLTFYSLNDINWEYICQTLYIKEVHSEAKDKSFKYAQGEL